MENYKLLQLIFPDGEGKFIVPSTHFREIMKDITNKEIKRYGPEVNVPKL
ncbi:hypothetical protein ACFLZ8_03735 [Planctomycetota bacterium]